MNLTLWTIRDSPGQLAKICQICSDMGVNIREVKHERAFLLDTVGVTQPHLDIEAKSFEHIQRLVERLKQEDFLDCHVITPFH
jgi:ACT domain-containing protein